MKLKLARHSADVAMSVIILVWGFHFIVLKDALSTVPPLVFNALRFTSGFPLMALIAWRYRARLHVPRRYRGWIVLNGLLGSVIYQAGFVLGLERTTSTNTALLVATMPTWTALFSILLGWVRLRRWLVMGIGITFAGVALVVLSRSENGLSLSHDDLTGSLILLGAALVGSISTLASKPLVDRVGGMAMAVWSYMIAMLGLVVLALPDLRSVSPDTFPVRVWPNIFYSGVLSSVAGFLVWNYAMQRLGPTRTASYHNFTPIVASIGGILVLGEPLTAGLLAGGVLTMSGVLIVRRNTFLRPAGEPAPVPEITPVSSPSPG